MNLWALAKRVAYWTVPPRFQSHMMQTWTALRSDRDLSPAMRALFERNIKFRNIHKGQRCFILATGPSINKQDLRPLKNEICFAVSQFYLHKDIREIDPLYHVDAPNHAPFGLEVLQKSFEGFKELYSDRTTYFFGYTPYEYSTYNFLEQNPQFKNDNMYFLNYSHSQPLDETNYKNPNVWDICKSPFSVRTVVYSAIQIAVYMGFKEIYLVGFDHDYLLNIARGHSNHFYKGKEEIDDSDGWLSTEEFFLVYHLRWKQYRLMQTYLETIGCGIYNATEGGLLDVFPRISLELVLAGNKLGMVF